MAKKVKKRGRATFIRDWRKYRGISQDRLAEVIGLTQATVARIERGDIAYTQPVLEAMAEALKCLPGDLITRNPTDRIGIQEVWDQIPEANRDQAAKVLETFKKAG